MGNDLQKEIRQIQAEISNYNSDEYYKGRDDGLIFAIDVIKKILGGDRHVHNDEVPKKEEDREGC